LDLLGQSGLLGPCRPCRLALWALLGLWLLTPRLVPWALSHPTLRLALWALSRQRLLWAPLVLSRQRLLWAPLVLSRRSRPWVPLGLLVPRR
jgi:hypothetical protein